MYVIAQYVRLTRALAYCIVTSYCIHLQSVSASFVDILHREGTSLASAIRYDKEFNVNSKAENSALSSTRSQKKKLKLTTPVPL